MSAGLASALVAAGLMRRAEAAQGFAALLARGDAKAGAILVVILEKGAHPRFFERALTRQGEYRWHEVGLEAGINPENAQKFLDRRRKFDPDLWLIELDVPCAERFAAEMNDSN